MLFPDAVQRAALAERSTAEPGSFQAPSLERSRVSSAPLFASRSVLRRARDKCWHRPGGSHAKQARLHSRTARGAAGEHAPGRSRSRAAARRQIGRLELKVLPADPAMRTLYTEEFLR